MRPADSKPADTALWSSAFRPFYLAGALFAPLLMLSWLGVGAGYWGVPLGDVPARAWHGHEFVYGFAAAIIVGIVLTALPSWAGTREITGGPLKVLVALWVLGRIAMLMSLPPRLAAFLDCALFAALFAMLAPQLVAVRNRYYLLLLPVLAGLIGGNAWFHAGRLHGDALAMADGLRLAVYSIVLLYALKGGVLTPIFSGNALRDLRRGDQAPFLPWLDALATVSVVLLAAADLARLPEPLVAAVALFAAIIHGGRLARWQGWRLLDVPLVLVMHLGYAWLVLALALRAAAGYGLAAPGAWLHAFTVGALGMMMLGLMLRVSLRHTGRALLVSPAMLAAWVTMFVAALLRVGAGLTQAGEAWLALSGGLWLFAFVVYLVDCGSMLWRPSLPQRR